uniref:Uncharacterized protein n=1 Tax=Oryza rufipogon TaxID=4529 RepID=A0A0E0NJK7_ORYRU
MVSEVVDGCLVRFNGVPCSAMSSGLGSRHPEPSNGLPYGACLRMATAGTSSMSHLIFDNSNTPMIPTLNVNVSYVSIHI